MSLCYLLSLPIVTQTKQTLPLIVIHSCSVHVKVVQEKESPFPNCCRTPKVDPKSSSRSHLSPQPAICPPLNHSLCALFSFSSPSKEGWQSYSVSSRGWVVVVCVCVWGVMFKCLYICIYLCTVCTLLYLQ